MLARPSRHNAKSVNRRFSTGAALLPGAFAVTALAGCGHASQGNAISIPRLERELNQVEYREKLAQGYTFHLSTRCDPSSGDLLHFVCAVTASGGQQDVHLQRRRDLLPTGSGQRPALRIGRGDALD